MSDSEQRLSIEDLAERLTRAEHTIRQWLRRDDFPDALKPELLGGRKKMVWSTDQIAGLEEYARTREANRGTFGRAPA